MTLQERLLARSEEANGCLLWTGGKSSNGYGQIWADGKMVSTHRAAYLTWIGEIPEGMKVLHTCDTHNCIAPDHLFLGTQLDNMNDMIEKGRDKKARGDSHYSRTKPSLLNPSFGRNNGRHTKPECTARGEGKGAQVKLTDEKVREIHALSLARGLTHRALATEFGVAHTTIGGVLRGTKWPHIYKEFHSQKAEI